INRWFWGSLIAIWLSVLLAFVASEKPFLGGTIGYELNDFLQDYIGKIGVALLLIFILIVYLVARLGITPDIALNYFKSQNSELSEELQKVSEENKASEELTSFDLTPGNDGPTVANYKVDKTSDVDIENSFEVKIANDEEIIQPTKVDDDDLKIEVKKLEKEKEVDDNLSDKLVKEFGEFDPK